jgi:DNA-binding transcriptional MerR regulator
MPPARRTNGGFRTYGADHERAARSVQLLKQAGFSLDEIRDTSSRLASQPTALAGLRQLQDELTERAEELRRRIAEQTRLLQQIEGAAAALDPCTGCSGKRFDGECLPCIDRVSGKDGPAPVVSLLHQASQQDLSS